MEAKKRNKKEHKAKIKVDNEKEQN